MDLIKEILKGILIGIANIIPGVSGGTMAVSMGIYDKIISSITNLFKDFKRSVMTLLPYGIGMVLGIVILSFAIQYLFDTYPFQTNLLFIGLIVGGVPIISKKVKGEKKNIGHIISFLVFFGFVIGLACLGGSTGTDVVIEKVTLMQFIVLFLVGVIASATMVIPGVSGSMVLMLLGYYQPILNTVTEFIKSAVSLDIDSIIHTIVILIPFGLGVVIGIFAIAKVIEIVFNKFPIYAYCAIIGLILASPFAILIMSGITGITLVSILTGIVTFVIGFVISIKLGE